MNIYNNGSTIYVETLYREEKQDSEEFIAITQDFSFDHSCVLGDNDYSECSTLLLTEDGAVTLLKVLAERLHAKLTFDKRRKRYRANSRN